MLTEIQASGYTSPNILRFQTPPHDPVRYGVRCEAPQGQNLSFSQLYNPDDKIRSAFMTKLGRKFAALNLREVLAPTVKHMSGIVLPASDFKEKLVLDCSVDFLRPLEPCDGTEVGEHAGFAMSAAGCPLLVLTFRCPNGNPRCLVAHAGRLSLYDEQFILTGVKSRGSFSVVDALVLRGIEMRGSPREMVLRSFFSIPWGAYCFPFDDTTWGEQNFLVMSHLMSVFGNDIVKDGVDFQEHLDLNELVAAQARKRGIGTIQTGLCTLPAEGPFAHTRHLDSSLAGQARNLVTLVR